MKVINKAGFTHTALLKPLAVSVSSCLLFACASTKTDTTSVAKPLPAPAITKEVPRINTTVVPELVGSEEDDYLGVLDQATLDELEDLLQATDMTMVEGDKLTVQRYGNLWDRVRRGYRMNHIQNKRIEAQKSWFYSRQDYLNRLTARTSRYLHHTVTEAERRGIPTELALLPIIESSYDPSATSNAAAAGLWQFIPSTGRIYGLNQSTTYDGRRDIIESTRAAYDFLTSLYNQFGSWELALAAYNAGPGRISRAIQANRNAGLPTDYWSLRLPTETMNYVPRFMAVAQIISSPSSYGVYLPAIANHTHFRAVPANYGVSLYDVSNVTGVPIDELRLLNPALINFSVDSAGPGRVIIPNSVPVSTDSRLTSLQGYGYGATSYVASDRFVVPKSGKTNPTARAELASANNLPTTSVQITPKNTIIQEPPLSQEERDFIAAQIQANTTETIQPVSDDGNIELTALQTGQSVLEARGETKSLSFNAPSASDSAEMFEPVVPDIVADLPKPEPTFEPKPEPKPEVKVKAPPKAEPKKTEPKKAEPKKVEKVERYKVLAGDTLTGIAAKHNLTVSQLASYNGITTTTQVKTGQRLWLVAGKVSTVAEPPKATTSASAKTTTHIVQTGESLTSVARKYNTTVQDVAALNGLSVTDGVLVGQKLSVPANIKATKTTAKPEPKASTQVVKYTVQSGDSLTSVANKYGIGVDELAAANNLTRDAGLLRGRTLTIPAKGTVQPKKAEDKKAEPTKTVSPKKAETIKKEDPKKSEPKKPEPKKADPKAKPEVAKGKILKNTENYQVQSGDSLISLAKKYGVSVADLAATNNLETNAQLKRGQTIKVPVLTITYTVKAGETLTSVAKKHGLTVAELAKMNKLDPKVALKSGQKLTVPNQ